MDVSKHPTLMNLLVRLNLLPSSVVKGIDGRITGKEILASVPNLDLDLFEQRLDEILTDERMAIEDRVYLIGLHKIKEKLGKDWASSEKKIHETVNSILKARLSSFDIHIQYDKESYLVVFASLHPKEAQLKCAAIGEEILEKLLERDSIADLMDINKITVGKNYDVRVEALPVIVDILEDAVVRSKIARLDEEKDDQQSDPSKSRPVSDLKGDIQLIFRPMLTLRSKIISTFMCVPIRPAINGFKSGYNVLGDPTDISQILSLDLWTIEKGADAINSLLTKKKNSLVALPVHFETLANHARRTKYVKALNALLNEHKKIVVLEIVELPDSVPQGRITELVSVLRPHGRAVMARFSLDRSSFSGFSSSGLHAVGFDLYSSHEREALVMEKMDVFINNAKKEKLKSYVLGLRSISLYTAAVTEGFDYISGYVLTSASKTADNFSEFNLGMPYQEVAAIIPSAAKD